MKNYLIDTHAHIDMIEEPIDTIIKDMHENNVQKVVIPAVEEETSDIIIKIAEENDGIYAMAGLFPTEAKKYTKEIEENIINRLTSPKIVAIGEIGLDYYWDNSFNEIQQQVFIEQIKIANEHDLPIVIHDREAHKDAFDIIKKYYKGNKVLFHCFSGSNEFMQQCVKQGWLIAIGGVVTFKNAIKIKEVAKNVPLNKLVLETDSPYLTPVPFRGKTNKPTYIKYVAEEIAKLRNMDINELIEITTNNAEEFFNI